jgi:tyrosine-protein kinase Etk/Wzc
MTEQSSVNRPQNQATQQMPDDEIDLRHLLALLIDGRYIIATVTTVITALALIYVVLSTPIYRANGIILVEDNAPGVPGLDDMAEIFASESSSATEIHVIKSRLVLGRVVDELGLTASVVPDYIPLFGELFARGIPAGNLNGKPLGLSGYAGGGEKLEIASLTVPRSMHGEDLSLIVETDSNFSLWYGNQKLLSGQVGELVLSDTVNADIRVDVLTARKGTSFTVVKTSKLETILDLQEQVKVTEKGKDTGIIEISLEGSDREKISRIVDSVSANYYLQNVQRMAAEAENSLDFLDEQIPRIQNELISSEEALNDYRSERTSVDLSLEAQSALDSLVQIEADISTMAINEADISRRFTSQHPNYISFKRQQSNLLGQREKLSRKLEALPDTQKKILRLKRDFEVNQAIFVALKNKRQELSILKASTVGNVRILDKAEVMPKAVAPKKGLIMVLAILLGGILGMLIVAAKNFLRAGVSDPKVFSDNGLMVHATIPHTDNEGTIETNKRSLLGYFKSKAKLKKTSYTLLAKDHPADLAIEALRSLRTSLHFSMLDASNNVVMISSASPGAGKSFISSNLAAVIAQTNQRVLVVDADMRKGYLHKRFNYEPEGGLSEVLAGTIEAKQAIKTTKVEGMDVITRGAIPSNPSELLMSAQFPALLAELESMYDLVIFDTPPILAVTDASIVGTYCGTSIMVARYESCTLREVNAANHRFDLGGVDIKGIVFNAVEKKASYYYYDYGYYNYEYKTED